MGRRLTALLSGRRKTDRAPLAALLALTRADVIWAAATALASAVLFATVLRSYPGLGDAAESVAGVSSLGILHAPGYPAYVIAAHIFTLLIPFGSEAFKVNLFSLVCGSVSVGVIHLLARRCGAARWAASIGALALAATAGFVFYSGFAKHDLFSGLLFLLGLYVALSWYNEPSRRRLVTLAVLIALGLGSSWPLEVLLLPTVLFILFVRRRRLAIWPLVQATAAGLLVLIAIYGFVMVRAAQNPAVNWGRATTVSRLIDLINRADFTPHHNPPQPTNGGASGGTPAAGTGQAPATGAGQAPAAGAGQAPADRRGTGPGGHDPPHRSRATRRAHRDQRRELRDHLCQGTRRARHAARGRRPDRVPVAATNHRQYPAPDHVPGQPGRRGDRRGSGPEPHVRH